MQPLRAVSSSPAQRRSTHHPRLLALAGLLALFLLAGLAPAARAEPWSPLQLGLFPPVQLVPASYDIYGLKLNLLIGSCRNLTGIDLGLAGEVTGQADGLQFALVGSQASRLNGLQISGLLAGLNQAGNAKGLQLGWGLIGGSNEAGTLTGLQIAAGLGLGWNVSKERISGLQLGAALIGLNRANAVRGLQLATLFNQADDLTGIQIGLVNYCRRLRGIQIGALNLIGESPWPLSPIVNARF